jgi:hypothetical protein
MTYLDLIQTAQNLANGSPLSASYVRDWNALEDTLLGKSSLEQVESIRTKAQNERGAVMAAGVLLTMLGE